MPLPHVDSMNMSDHVEFDAPQTSDLAETMVKRLLKGIPLTWGWTMTCLVYMSWCKEVWNHLTHSPHVKWPVRLETIFMRVGSSLPISLLYQFWWICLSALHPAPHRFRHNSYVNVVVVSQWDPNCSNMLTERLARYHCVHTTKGCQYFQWAVELIIVCKPPNRGCTLLDTSGVAPILSVMTL